MQLNVVLRPSELPDFLLNVAVVRPVFIWGAPGIGKSSLVAEFAGSLGMECVSLLGSQLAPEDLIGVPQVQDGVSRFCPPAQIVHTRPFCLFLDELNACTQEVQKAFYSLIHRNANKMLLNSTDQTTSKEGCLVYQHDFLMKH